MKLEEIYKLFIDADQKITTDSRACEEGALFFALKGDSFNGNKFAAKALNDGCAYAIVDENEYVVDERCVLVDDVLATMQDLARYHRQLMDIPVIGITGTNGKTTTKELTAAVLKKKYNLLYTEGNFNNHIGVPLTLLRMRREHDMALVEMGANHIGEIRELVNIACPTSGLITNVGKAHLEGFGSLGGVIKTKSEMYDYLRDNKGKVFVDANNVHLINALGDYPALKYGVDSKEAKVRAWIEGKEAQLSIAWESDDVEKQVVRTQLIGAYNAENVLAAIAVGLEYGVEVKLINEALDEYKPTNSRSELKETERNTLIVDAYNANPTSMTTALRNFSDIEANHKCVILGDMLELGEQSELEHRGVVEMLHKLNFEKVILVGEVFKAVASAEYSCFDSSVTLRQWIEENKIEGKYILIKGSNGIKLKDIVDVL